MKPVEILEKYWGHKQFRPLQENIIQSVISGKDTLAILPTGGGKSICFQIPGLISEGITLVISPLISLMNDQVKSLRLRNISALALHSGLTKKECEIEYQNLRNGKYKFVYVSPERLKTEPFQETIYRTNVKLLAIDEAHCISQWGYDFRPEYLLISELRKNFKNCPCIALTASATPKVQADITEYLLFEKGFEVFKQSIVRNNLSYVVLREENKLDRLVKICNRIKGTGIVYTKNRKSTAEISKMLNAKGISSDFYHAGLSYDEKIIKQDSWQKGDTRIIVCTNAFGMGIDKSNVRFVVHYDLTESPEAYYQEAGRSGRDGEESWCILMYCESDLKNTERMLQSRFLDKKTLESIYKALCNHLQIPYGGGLDENYELDTAELNRKYNLKSTEIHTALSMLEKEGILKLSDSFSNPSRLRILADNTEIYAFYLKNAGYEPLIKTILRMYGGLYDNYVQISEYDLALILKVSVNKIKEGLTRLTTLKIMDYVPQNQKPLIFMMSERPVNFPFDTKRWQFLKQAAETRMRAMFNYLDENKCRQSSLSHYFGEKETFKCGKCDVCRANKEKPEDTLKDVKTSLKTELMQKSQSLEDILKILNDEPSKIEAFRFLLDAGHILKTDLGEYLWVETKKK